MTGTPTTAEIQALWQDTLPGLVPHPRGLADRLASPAELLWRRDDTGRLLAVAACRPPETHLYGYLRLLLVHPDWQRRGLGRALVAEVRQRLPGVPLALGEERGHFFAGATLPSVPFWQAVGFMSTGSQSVDMRCDLRGLPAAAPLPAGLRLATASEPGVLDGVLALTREVFSPRWTFDAASAAARAPWQVLALLEGSRVLGFALVGTADDPAILPSVLYPQALAAGFGAVQLGGLGPVGLHPSARGRGLGRALMLAAMHHLRGRSVEVMGIDWTGIASFYERLGFTEWNRHQHMRG